MSFAPAVLPRAIRLLRARPPNTTAQFRCLYTPSNVSRPRVPWARTDFQKPHNRSFRSSPVSSASIKNPYKVLGVGKSASTSQIKKAYYQAAKKYHPDSSKEPNAHEKFQEVQSAYEILSDPQKKEQFDQYGEQAFDPSGGSSPGAGGPFSAGADGFSGFGGGFGAEFSFEDLFSAFGGGASRGRRRGGFSQEVLVGEDIEIQVTISFMEAAKGTAKEFDICPSVKCSTCSGTGMKAGTSQKECGRCGGTGTRIHFMQGGFQMAATCDTCRGNGVTIPKGSECGSCRGSGVVRKPARVPVDIPAGVEEGMKLKISEEGDAPAVQPGSKVKTHRGDLIIHIRVAPHESFGRSGADVLYSATIPMTTAVLGGTIKVPTLDGDVEMKVPAGTGTGDKIMMNGMGMRKIGSNKKGDLKVNFKVKIPKVLTTSQTALLELLADEMKDNSAKRTMNFSQYKDPSSGSPGSESTEHHGHEGFLKRIWDKLTHHNNQNKPGSDEKKKASGSG